jgi:Trypsin
MSQDDGREIWKINLFEGRLQMLKRNRIINKYLNVSFQSGPGVFCGGSLVASDVVLTAAH